MSIPVFIDAAYAAEMLHISQDAVLDLIETRKLRTYGGSRQNPFVRSADISALVVEIGQVEEEDAAPRRVKSASAKVQTRLTADARWSDITEDDVYDWARRAEPARRQAAIKAARTAIDRLALVLQALDGERTG